MEPWSEVKVLNYALLALRIGKASQNWSGRLVLRKDSVARITAGVAVGFRAEVTVGQVRYADSVKHAIAPQDAFVFPQD